MKKNGLYLKTIYVLLLVFIVSSCKKQSTEEVDLLIHNAVIWTGDSGNSKASVIAIKGNTFFDVGKESLIKKYKAKRIIDAQGKFITPGFIDSHVHFLSSSYGLSAVQLRDAGTPEEFIKRIKAKAKTLPEGSWILEGDWDHTLWGGELPKAAWIDSVTPNHPVSIGRLDGHMILANSVAMKLAGVDKNTADVDGGTIVRDNQGNPEGVFKDNAEFLIEKAITEPTPEQNDAAFIDGMKYVASKGVTTVHNMDRAAPEIIEQYKRIKDNHITRFYLAVELSHSKKLKSIIENEGNGDEWLKIGVLKGMVDGSLGSHTAAFHEPYTDKPEDKGFFILTQESLYDKIKQADDLQLHLAVHAIGDRAISELLDVYERVIEENGPRERRLRIEHSQHPRPEDIERFKELNIISSMQPFHAIDDGRWAENVIGSERIKSTYAFKSFLDAEVMLAFGSDWSVAPPTPLEGIYAAVTRRTIDNANENGWVPLQKISVEEALKAYTINGAYASFEEDIKGTITPGKLADFVILDQNILEIDPVLIKNATVKTTYVGGKQVYPYD